MIKEFEYKAHKFCAENGTASGADLNAIWTNLSKEYGSDSVEFYDEDSAEWAYINIFTLQTITIPSTMRSQRQ